MKNIQNQPSSFVQLFMASEKTKDAAAKHKLLLDLGETFLTYLTGIMFGEYKKKEAILEKLETQLYKNSGRNPSFGVYLSFLRDHLSSGVENSILADKLKKDKKHELVSNFVFEFNLIKENINTGKDEGFTEDLDLKRKGKSIGKKNIFDFFETFITIRNIYAHPEEKAGPKNIKRKWPLGGEYYQFINPLLQSSLIEIINDFEILQQYKSILTKDLDDKNKKGKFLLETGKKGKEIDMDLSHDQLRKTAISTRYLVDNQEEIYARLYANSIPELNPKVAKEIIKQVKAKEIEPIVNEMILSKLSDDGRIDEMEYLVLYDTASMANMSAERLFELIDKKRKELNIDATLGTPNDKGTLFVQVKDNVKKISFNPWWMHYLSMVPKLDKGIVSKEKGKVDTLRNKVEKLKINKKENPIVRKIDSIKKKLKVKKNKRADLIKNTKIKKAKKNTQIKKASNAERKEKYRNELSEIKNGFDLKLNNFEKEITELKESLANNEKLLLENIQEIDNKLKIAKHELESFFMMTKIGMHKNLWNEINQYIDQIIQNNLNVKETKDLVENEEITEGHSLGWKNIPNNWIIGELAYTYWGKIYPKHGPLGRAYNIGYAVSNRFKWVPKNIEESLLDALNKPSTLIWTTTDDKWVAKIDLDGSITQKREELNMELIEKYEKEFLSMGVNVRYHLSNTSAINAAISDKDVGFMTLENFLKEKEKYTVSSIFSRIWPIDSFYKNGRINLEAIAQYEREMSTLITIFSNSLITLNDYALENGVNQDTIDERFDHFNRAQKHLLEKIQKNHPVGKKFEPTKEETDQWRILLKDNFEIDDYLFDRAFETVRWKMSSNGENSTKEESNDPK